MTLYYPTSQNFVQKTLDAQLLSGATASLTLNNVTGIQNKPGVCIIDRVDTNGVETESKREVIVFTGVSGVTLTGLTRNADNSGSDQDHAVGAIVEFVSDALWAQGLIDTVLVEHNTDGTHKAATVTTLKATAAEVATGTEDAKIVTPLSIAGGSVLSSGWTSAAETWTYASASTITVPSGAASKYQKGDRIRLKQGAGYKYYVVASVADTVLTVAVNTDYTVANQTITDNYYSHEANPIGYPTYFYYTPSLTYAGGTTNPTTIAATGKYSIVANQITYWLNVNMSNRGSGDRQYIICSVPIQPTNNPEGFYQFSFTNMCTTTNIYNRVAQTYIGSNNFTTELPGAMTGNGLLAITFVGFF